MRFDRGARLFVGAALAATWLAAHGVHALPPEHNRADLSEPPPRPSADARVEALGKALFDAIVRDRPELAETLFFPRAAFLEVKAIRDPGGYWDELHARFIADIHALHAALGDAREPRFERFELAERGGWVRVGEEANRLPYWASRHSALVYREGPSLHRFEVRVLITWDDRWYVIHLNEFHKR